MLAAAPASAQEARDLRVRVGVGGQLIPKYVGAKDYKLFPLLDLDFAHGSDPFRFEVPDELKEAFRFRAGQHLSVRAEIGGEEVRRNYSLCVAPSEDQLKVTVFSSNFSTAS